jgi:uncharacterized protein (TIGR02599 family)
MFASRHTTVSRRPARPTRLRRAFTLIELLVSMSVLSILMLLVTQVIGQVQKTWSGANSRVSQFREARTAFDLVTHNLSQAELNPFWSTDQGGITLTANTYQSRSAQIPTQYVRKSDLQFICGNAVDLVKGDPAVNDANHLPYHAVFFQAALGVTQTPDYERLQSLLCGRGYFVEYGDDAAYRPPFVVATANRYRLMEFSPTAENNNIYAAAPTPITTPQTSWYAAAGAPMTRASDAAANGTTSVAVARGYTRPVAENIIALIIAPRVTSQEATAEGQNDPHWIAPNFAYDSTKLQYASSVNPQGIQNLLPPLVDVIMVAIDEASQSRFTPEAQKAGYPSMAGLLAAAPFNNALNLDLGMQKSITTTDLQTLENYLVTNKVNYRVFSSTIEIRAAHWSL